MSRVLVTGATGFTARYVIPLLRERGHEVRGLSSADCDIRDARALLQAVSGASPEKVLHLAGTPNLADTEAELLFGVNVAGTANLLAACATLDCAPRIVLASSCYVYGDTGGAPAAEDAPLAPTGAYGRSKLQMERLAREWMVRLPILIVRPFNYTGVGHDARFLIPKLVRAFRERASDVSFVDAGVTRDFSDVRWLAEIYAGLLDHGQAGATFNVCSGAGTALAALVELLCQLTGHRPAAEPKPSLGRMAARQLVGSPARLHSLFGRESPYSLRDTLQWMLAAA